MSDLAALDALLEHQSYLSGHSLSSSDLDTFVRLKARFPSPLADWTRSHPHLLRWWNHVASFSTEGEDSVVLVHFIKLLLCILCSSFVFLSRERDL